MLLVPIENGWVVVRYLSMLSTEKCYATAILISTYEMTSRTRKHRVGIRMRTQRVREGLGRRGDEKCLVVCRWSGALMFEETHGLLGRPKRVDAGMHHIPRSDGSPGIRDASIILGKAREDGPGSEQASAAIGLPKQAGSSP